MIPRFVTMVTFMKMEHTIRGAGLRERDVWFLKKRDFDLS